VRKDWLVSDQELYRTQASTPCLTVAGPASRFTHHWPTTHGQIINDGLPPAVRAGVARPNFERIRVRKPDNSHSTALLEPGQHRVILERLHGNFYEEPGPATRIASAVLAALLDLDKSPSLIH
jgi:hypothetical protein